MAITLLYKYDTFMYWFKNIHNDTYYIYNKHRDYLGMLKGRATESEVNIELLDLQAEIDLDIVKSEFEKFQLRPESILAKPIKNEGLKDESEYDMKLVAAILTRAYDNGSNPDDALATAQKAIDWLHSTDFYTAPASTRYHEAEVSGLLMHTLKVVNFTIDLLNCDTFKTVPTAEAILVALVHDWCKIGYYTTYAKNVKDSSGTWVQQQAFTYKDQTYTCLGHGVSSMLLADRFFGLTMPELLAIRWHMSSWRVVDGEIAELEQANIHYPIVHLLQFADQLSITKY